MRPSRPLLSARLALAAFVTNVAFAAPALVVGAFLLVAFPTPASATKFEYILGNHPGGVAGPPLYGLRLDELFDVTSDHDRFTFDFEDPSIDDIMRMSLVYDDVAETITIAGDVVGGLVDNGSRDPDYSGQWRVHFVYSVNVSGNISGDDVELEVDADNPANMGTITPILVGSGIPSLDPINLVDEQGMHSFSFRFNNTEDHRLDGTGLSGPDTLVGWGWLNHSDEPHVKSSDWLFTGVIPEPGTASLLGVGLVWIALSRRQRARRQR